MENEQLPKYFKPPDNETWVCWFIWLDAVLESGEPNAVSDAVQKQGGMRCFSVGIVREVTFEGVTIALEKFEDRSVRGVLTVPRDMVQAFDMHKMSDVGEMFPDRIFGAEEHFEQRDEEKGASSDEPSNVEAR